MHETFGFQDGQYHKYLMWLEIFSKGLLQDL